MKHLSVAVIALGFLISSHSTSIGANTIANSVDELVKRCTYALADGADLNWAQGFEAGECIGWITGISKSMHQQCAIADAHPSIPLTPDHRDYARLQGHDPKGYSNGALVRIVVKYAEENPERWKLGPYYMTTEALRKAAPCPPKKAD